MIPATALVADDEPPARRALRELLAAIPWIGEVRETVDGPTTQAAVDDFRPTLLFLDIQMPGLSGMDVLRRVTHRPIVVFTTAFDQYAIDAFELEAFDYLLKPFGRQRFSRVMERLRETCQLHAQRGAGSNGAIDRLYVRTGKVTLPVPLASVERLEAADDLVAVCAAGRRYLMTARLRDVAARLPADRFVRVHRSHVVNLDFVAGYESTRPDQVRVRMRNGEWIPASKAGTARLRALRKAARP